MSEAYRAGRGSAAIRDERDVGAYLATRLPATYAAVAAALDAVMERAPSLAPKSLLDVGAGPGTASWAAVERWRSIEAVRMTDSNARFLAAAETLARASPHPALSTASIERADVAAAEFARFDAIIAGYALGELQESAFAAALRKLWTACAGVMLIVEPGTPAGFERVLEARRLLIELGARIVAPCPGPYACPMAEPAWCHFAVRLQRSRAHLRTKGADVPFEDEKFSYLAVAREGIALEPIAGRIVAPPRRLKPEMRLTVCGDGSFAERAIPSRDRPAFKRALKKRWGDAI